MDRFVIYKGDVGVALRLFSSPTTLGDSSVSQTPFSRHPGTVLGRPSAGAFIKGLRLLPQFACLCDVS